MSTIDRLNILKEKLKPKRLDGIDLYNLSKEEIISILNDVLDSHKEQRERIEKAVEYIENNSLYYQEYDYDYEENLVLGEPDDRVAKKELLEILKDSDKIE